MTEAEHRTVAVVDDDLAVRDSLRLLLEVVGYTVEIFASAAEFLQANVRHFACLILDHHMPNMTGLELAWKTAYQWRTHTDSTDHRSSPSAYNSRQGS